VDLRREGDGAERGGGGRRKRRGGECATSDNFARFGKLKDSIKSSFQKSIRDIFGAEILICSCTSIKSQAPIRPCSIFGKAEIVPSYVFRFFSVFSVLPFSGNF
jgi:hypothetical protein